MDTPNLAIVFAPNIARPDELSPNELAEAPLIAAAVSSFIRNAAACFGVSDGGGGDAGSDAALSRRGTEATAPSVGALGGSAAELRPEQAGSSDGGGGQWWYSQEGEQLGPVTAAELQRLLQEGTLHMGTYVFEDGTEDWAELHTVIDKL